MTPLCPHCYSENTVCVWDGDSAEGTPDYFGCYTCDSEMVRLADVRDELARWCE